MCRMTKLKNDGLKLNSCYKRLSCKKFWRNLCNIIVEKTYVNLYIPCNISCLLYPCTICFAVYEISHFEPKAKNTFPSFRTQRSMKISSFFEVFSHCRSICLFCVVWWWWFYICLNECLWMQMTWCNVSCKWISEYIFKNHNHSPSSPWEWFKSFCRLLFGFTVYFSVYQRWLFAVSLP